MPSCISLQRRWRRCGRSVRTNLTLIIVVTFVCLLFLNINLLYSGNGEINFLVTPNNYSGAAAASNASNDRFTLISDSLPEDRLPNAAAQWSYSSETCVQGLNTAGYPRCLEKIEWMKIHREEHSCYAELGVNNHVCSIVRYLHEVELYCPPLNEEYGIPKIRQQLVFATINTNLTELLQKFVGNPQQFSFMTKRLKRLWPKWVDSARSVQKDHPETFTKLRKKKIIVHLGFLASIKQFGSWSQHGGPLGELLQWSDLLAALHVLGHQIIAVSTEKVRILKLIQEYPSKPCPSHGGLDLLFTDIMGVNQLPKQYRALHRCLLRVLDSFGTQAEFNSKKLFTLMRSKLGSKRNPWGNHQLNLKQFFTFYPHSDDNTYLGFVVVPPEINSTLERTNSTLVYGKVHGMWKGFEETIAVASEFGEVFATVSDANPENRLPEYVTNYGLLSESKVHETLNRVKVFLGLGFPIEGPAPLEAIANGAVFINARFDPPRSRLSYEFFNDKPTIRQLASQVTYAEKLGEPYSITVDVKNQTQLRLAMKRAMELPSTRYIPPDLTPYGMLLRVGLSVEKEVFCAKQVQWPPKEALKVVLGESLESCSEACQRKAMKCEHSLFVVLNEEGYLSGTRHCVGLGLDAEKSLTAPYTKERQGPCVRQEDPLYYSCVRKPEAEAERRICPCVELLEGHSSICKQCV